MDGRFISIGPSEKWGPSLLVDLRLDSCYIFEITQTFTNGTTDSEDFNISPEEQNEAIELLHEFFEMYDFNPSETTPAQESNRLTNYGVPRRIEAVIRQKESGVCALPHSSTSGEKRIVILSVMEATDIIDYTTLRGRERYTNSGYIQRSSTGSAFDSDKWWIAKLEEFSGSHKSSARHYSVARQADALNQIHAFLKKLSIEEIGALRKWDPKPEKAYPGGYSGDYSSGYSTGFHGGGAYSYEYKPAIGSLRKSGDDVGAKLCLEQAENLIKAEMYTIPTMEEFLEEAEKKAKAEEEEPGPNPSSATTNSASGADDGAGGDSSGSAGAARLVDDVGASSCPYCGDVDCEDCGPLHVEGIMLFNPGSDTLH